MHHQPGAHGMIGQDGFMKVAVIPGVGARGNPDLETLPGRRKIDGRRHRRVKAAALEQRKRRVTGMHDDVLVVRFYGVNRHVELLPLFLISWGAVTEHRPCGRSWLYLGETR